MADEPDNIVLAQLRETRERLREQKGRFDAIDAKLASMADNAQKSQNIAFWALGRSEWATVQNAGQDERLNGLDERASRANDRLDALETSEGDRT